MNARAAASLGPINYTVSCTIGVDARHVITADEPADLGGQDTGPTPVELFCASVAACKAMTARMYADRKQWPAGDITCTVAHDQRVQQGGDKPTKVHHLDISIAFTGELDDEQRARLKEIAERCPVQRMIEGDCVITTTLD